MANRILQVGMTTFDTIGGILGGTNAARVAVDTAANLVWHRYQRLTVVTSGITLHTPCVATGPSTSLKLNNLASQNGTVVLANVTGTNERKTGNVAVPLTIDLWANATCSGSPSSSGSFFWEWMPNLGGGGAATGEWTFGIWTSSAGHAVFIARSTSWCFPQTINNEYELADAGLDVGGRRVLGYGGSMTIGLSNSCP